MKVSFFDGSQQVELDAKSIVFSSAPENQDRSTDRDQLTEFFASENQATFEIKLGDPLKTLLHLGAWSFDTAEAAERWLKDGD